MVGFREHLDLSEIVSRYESFNPDLKQQREKERWLGLSPTDTLSDHHAQPHIVGSGPSECSSSRVLAHRRFVFAWDPNRYYRSLQIPWPYVHATKKDLREAYQRLNGQQSPWLTYCLKRLLDPEVRERYDHLELGEGMLDDIYVQDYLRRRAHEEIARRSNLGQYQTIQQILEEWGMTVVPDDAESEAATSNEVLDSDGPDELNDLNAREPDPWWGYSFYIWKSAPGDESRLMEWQSRLIASLDEQGATISFSVGYMGRGVAPSRLKKILGSWVFFLHEDEEPSAELARRTTEEVLLHMAMPSD